MISDCRIVDERDLSAWCWRELRFWQHTESVKEKIIRRHGVPSKHISNALKQAKQIRSCLQQADEYFKSASLSSISIKPVLLYYSCMSLALAEVLWKGTGKVSLDALRAEHRHHGLSFALDTSIVNLDLGPSLGALTAKPMVTDHGRVGTFDVWHRSARHLPQVGEFEGVREHGIRTTGFEGIFIDEDKRMPLIESGGISFFDAIKYIPEMQEILRRVGIETGACRAWISRRYRDESARRNLNNNYINSVNLHPGNKAAIDRLIERVKCSASAVDAMTLIDLGDSAQILEDRKAFDSMNYSVDYPSGFNRNSKEVYLVPNNPSLNEFGMYYVGLFMLGNLCRYYPDIWMRLVEQDRPFATVSWSFLEVACKRMPMLTLSELEEQSILERH